MFRYKIFLYSVENNKIIEREYICRKFGVNYNSLFIYPIDYSEPTKIHLDSSMRFEVIPCRYLLEIS